MLEKNSPTRLTLALDIIRKIEQGRFRGYHELSIVKHQIDLADTISIENAPAMSIGCDDALVPVDKSNLCWKAVDLVKTRFRIDRSVRMNISKRIPVMGGLAGGSANAATMLMLLNELWDLKLGTAALMELGRELGMDVPFYFAGGTAFDTETTGILEPIDCAVNLSFVLAIPEFGVSTAHAYATLNYAAIGKQLSSTVALREALERNDSDSIPMLMHNDFELSVFSQYPRLARLKAELLRLGCVAASLSGSGSTIIGLASDRKHASLVANKLDCRTIVASTLID